MALPSLLSFILFLAPLAPLSAGEHGKEKPAPDTTKGTGGTPSGEWTLDELDAQMAGYMSDRTDKRTLTEKFQGVEKQAQLHGINLPVPDVGTTAPSTEGGDRGGFGGPGANGPGGFTAGMIEAVNNCFGAGTFDRFGLLLRDDGIDFFHKRAVSSMIWNAGDYANIDALVKKGQMSPESQEYKDKIGAVRDDIRRNVDRLETDRENRPTPQIKERVLGQIPEVIRKIFPGKPGAEDSLEPSQPKPPTPNQQVYQGQGYLRDGDVAAAKDAFGKALAADPRNQAALSGRARANYLEGNYGAAVQDAKAALSLDPNDKMAHGTLMLSDNRVEGADASAAASGLGAAMSGFGQGAAAAQGSNLGVTKEAVLKSGVQARQAEKALKVGDYEAARSLARRALDINPNNAQAHFYASVANANMRRYQDALASAEAGLRLAPLNPALLNAKAFALNRLGKHKEALDAAEAALRVNPGDAYALANRAYALGGLGDREGMLASLRKAAEINPRFNSSLESALQMPSDSDLLFLFPGETRPAPESGRLPDQKGRGIGLGTLATVLAGALLVAGLAVFFLGGGPAKEGRPAPQGPSAGTSPSTLLRDQYQIVRQIGGGGMGVVYEGLDKSLNRKVAIKKMRDEIRLDRRERDRFLAEARTVAALHHPNIVDIYSIIESDGDVYLVFEFIAGRTLFDAAAKDGPVKLSQAVVLFQGIAAALDFAHGHGVIHRDLKPSNVMIDEEGFVKVMDFGVARVAKDAGNKFSMTNTVMGTPPYMAPEAESGVVRRESDVYSMAVCLYEVLCGRQPFVGVGAGMLLNKMNASFVPATKAVPGLPPGIDEVFSKAFAPVPEKRYAGAGEMIKAVEALAKG